MKWYPVLVTLDDGEKFYDEIRGYNEKGVLKSAYWNWPHATKVAVLKELPPDSYYYWGYNNRHDDRMTGYTYTRPYNPYDTTGYADRPVTHVILEDDVIILGEDEDGVAVEWDAEKGDPFINIMEGSVMND